MKTPNQQVSNGQVLKFLKDYWFMVAVIFGMAFSWANFTRDIAQNTTVNTAQALEISQTKEDLNQQELTYIEDITFIKTKLESLIK